MHSLNQIYALPRFSCKCPHTYSEARATFVTTFSLHLWNAAKSFQNHLTPPGLPPSDTFFPLFRLQRFCLLLSPSLLSLVQTHLCLHLSNPLRPSSTTLITGHPTSTPYSISVFLAIHHVCIIRGPPLASPRQQIPPILSERATGQQ